MDFSSEMNKSEVRNTEVDDFVTLITLNARLLCHNPNVVIFGATVIIIAAISLFLQRFNEHKRTKYLGSFEDKPGRGNSIDESSLKLDDKTTKNEKYLEEFYYAADRCYIKKYGKRCRELVDYCPHMINTKFASTGHTPFHRVCFHGDASLIQYMLTNGANPRLISDAGESPICLAIYHCVNKKNYRKVEEISCIDILLRAGCSLDKNRIWYDALLNMTMAADNKSLTQWLLSNGEDLLWFASWLDTILTFAGLLAAFFSGICVPGIIILYGNLSQVFVQYEINMVMASVNGTSEIPVGFRSIDSSDIGPTELASRTLNFSILSAAFAIAQFVFTSMYTICLNRVSLRCTVRTRLIYFKALLRQSGSWFDLQNSEDFATNSIGNTSYLEASLGEKLGTFVSSTMAACTCIVVALYYGYRLAGSLLIAAPILPIIIYIAKRTNDAMKKEEDSLYAPAETTIRECLSNIRSIIAYSGESNECKNYVKRLARVEDIAVTRGVMNGVAGALLSSLIYCMYGFAFWHGVELMRHDHDYTVRALIVIIDMIKRVPRAGVSVDLVARTVKPEMVVVFENVVFAYPSRAERIILRDVSFGVPRGKSIAIVGPSNSGKTTCTSLVHRFYDPQRGTIRLDGVDIRELNEDSLRRYVGYAQQCPVLFGTTIGEGITCHSSCKRPIYMETVSKIVGIHSFVMEFPQRYNNPLTRDLSVDVRQRLALARVLYRKPNVLLIDNALSALSFEAEANVYESIRSAFADLTIIIVTNNPRILKTLEKIVHLENKNVTEFTSMQIMMNAHPACKKMITERSDAIEDTDIETTFKCKHAASTSKIFLPNGSNLVGTSYQELLRFELVRIGRYPAFFQVTDIPTTDNILIGDMISAKLRKLLLYNRNEWLQLLLACIAAAIIGFGLPIYAILFGETLSLVALHNGPQLEIRLNFFTNMFLVAGFVSGISTIIQGYMLSIAGSKLTTRMRKRAFKRILQRSMEWYDCETNDEDRINSLLRTSSPRIQQACGQKIVFMVQAVTSLTVSIVLSMSYSWKMGLVTVIFTPLSLLLLRYNSKLQLRRNFYTSVYLNRTKEIIVETVTNAKCIAALTLEEAFFERYRDELKGLVMHDRYSGWRALVYGGCVALPAIAYAVSMFYGGYMLKNNEIEIGKVFKVAEAIIPGTLMVGHLVFFAPNITKSQIAAVKLLRIIERPVSLLISKDRKKLEGGVTFDDVSFQHPHYAGLPKLGKFSIDVKPGESVGLVGRPHSGVSIPIELILGFYGLTSGKITFDGERRTSFDTNNLRMQIGLVEGDPTFFQRSIADNISYGDLLRDIRMEEIIEASRDARLDDFIVSLPRGYRTILDDSVELTTSQKIRLSLARALIRKPKILLFLDLKRGESEEAEVILRGAIGAACAERTSIASSHDPFSAVQLFSRLFVINKGTVVETGIHEELVNAKGFYTKLCVASRN